MKLNMRHRAGIADAARVTGPVCTPEQIVTNEKWPSLQNACVPVAVQIPLPGIRLRDVQALVPGTTFESCWPANEEVPLFAAGVPLSWCEFEGVEQKMAIRVTRLG